MIHGIFAGDDSGHFKDGRLTMYRVFDPMPLLQEGATMEFVGPKYYVVKGGERIASGNIVEVDEDLITMKYNPDKMMILLARIRKLIRLHRDGHPGVLPEIFQWLPEGYNEHCPVPATTQGESGLPGGI
jgi:hypothetical protein